MASSDPDRYEITNMVGMLRKSATEREEVAAALVEIAGAHMPISYEARDIIAKAAALLRVAIPAGWPPMSDEAEMTAERTKPVAWRVKDFADGWILFQDRRAAVAEAQKTGALLQSLYIAAPAGWQPIETAPSDTLVWTLWDGLNNKTGKPVRYYHAAIMCGETGEWSEPEYGDFIDEPTHWMPLPKPPEPMSNADVEHVEHGPVESKG